VAALVAGGQAGSGRSPGRRGRGGEDGVMTEQKEAAMSEQQDVPGQPGEEGQGQ
jgi:hypothetical protein